MDLFDSRKEASDTCKTFIPLVLYGELGGIARKWCEDYTSPGRFYNGSHGWYFELECDALLFTMRWCSK